MTCYSIDPRDGMPVKGYGFLTFAENMSTTIGKFFYCIQLCSNTNIKPFLIVKKDNNNSNKENNYNNKI